MAEQPVRGHTAPIAIIKSLSDEHSFCLCLLLFAAQVCVYVKVDRKEEGMAIFQVPMRGGGSVPQSASRSHFSVMVDAFDVVVQPENTFQDLLVGALGRSGMQLGEVGSFLQLYDGTAAPRLPGPGFLPAPPAQGPPATSWVLPCRSHAPSQSS